MTDFKIIMTPQPPTPQRIAAALSLKELAPRKFEDALKNKNFVPFKKSITNSEDSSNTFCAILLFPPLIRLLVYDLFFFDTILELTTEYISSRTCKYVVFFFIYLTIASLEYC